MESLEDRKVNRSNSFNSYYSPQRQSDKTLAQSPRCRKTPTEGSGISLSSITTAALIPNQMNHEIQSALYRLESRLQAEALRQI
jgi:hydroxymethylpyrimidine/phosphomethylpyrimidine kinase